MHTGPATTRVAATPRIPSSEHGVSADTHSCAYRHSMAVLIRAAHPPFRTRGATNRRLRPDGRQYRSLRNACAITNRVSPRVRRKADCRPKALPGATSAFDRAIPGSTRGLWKATVVAIEIPSVCRGLDPPPDASPDSLMNEVADARVFFVKI